MLIGSALLARKNRGKELQIWEILNKQHQIYAGLDLVPCLTATIPGMETNT